jgi:hypothetical protein
VVQFSDIPNQTPQQTDLNNHHHLDWFDLFSVFELPSTRKIVHFPFCLEELSLFDGKKAIGADNLNQRNILKKVVGRSPLARLILTRWGQRFQTEKKPWSEWQKNDEIW